MSNPVLVEVTRGPLVESRHRGAICVVDGDGTIVMSVGDVERPVFPRSAVKAIQALPFVESGAFDALLLEDEEEREAALALACSSHNGEARHVAMAERMLAAAGLNGETLECGGHWSRRQAVYREQLARYGGLARPPAVCNNCSGKHSGFVCTAAHLGEDPRGYTLASHATQERVRESLQSVTGAAHGRDLAGIDGCSIPTYAVPLRALAHGFARMTTGVGLEPLRAQAARRIMKACMARPFFVAGSGRFCTAIMEAAPGRVFAKTGAEGVFCGALPELGLGIALKCDDGATRAAEAMMGAVCGQLLGADGAGLASLGTPDEVNWRAVSTGRVRVSLPG